MFGSIKLVSVVKIVTCTILINTSLVGAHHEKNRGFIYILSWSGVEDEPVVSWSKNQKSLLSNNCEYSNCFIVKNKEYFSDVTDYDAVLFSIAKLGIQLPDARSDNQIYILIGREPAPFWQIVGSDYNGFFNYTWTYRLDSDIVYPYFIVKDKMGKIVGPTMNARWRNVTRMKDTPQNVVEKLKNKTTAVAWFVTNCFAYNNRLGFGQGIHSALQKYNLKVDIYGNCGELECAKTNNEHCLDVVEKYYYFYLAFENSNGEDYVTEKLYNSLNHYTVPIVFGGANYSRFLPDGIYINANTLTEEEVANQINDAISEKKKYYDYFKWHRYYVFEEPEGGPTDPICSLCAFMNNESIRKQRRAYARIDSWWNEFKSQNEDGVIVTYASKSPLYKSVITYRDKSKDGFGTEILVPAPVDQANNFVSELVNYFFGD